MGEIAEAYINGFYCESCGEMLDGDEPGYTRICLACAEAEFESGEISGREIVNPN